MATYHDDFGSSSISDDAPSGWTWQWRASGTSVGSLVSDASAEGGYYYQHNVAISGRYGLSFDSVSESETDMEILTKLQYNDTDNNDANYYTFVRMSGSGGSETAYTGRWHPGNTNLEITRYDGGAYNWLASGDAPNYSAGDWYWVRVKVSGSTIQARTWLDGDSEPETWNVETTDTNIDSGGAGIGCYDSNNEYRFDFVSVGTGTDSAPLPSELGGQTYDVSLSDSFSLTDSPAPALGAQRLSAVSAVVADTLAREVLAQRLASTGLTATTGLLQEALVNRTITDPLTLTESLARVADFAHSLADTAGVTDAHTFGLVARRLVLEDLVLADVTRLYASRFRSQEEALTVSDQARASATLLRVLAQALGTTDSTQFVAEFPRTLLASAGVVDSLFASSESLRVLLQDTAVVDSLGALIDANRLVEATLSVADLAEALEYRITTLLLRSSLGLSDSVEQRLVATRGLTQGISVEAILGVLTASLRQLGDQVGLSDAVDPLITKIAVLREALGTTDLATRSSQSSRELTSDLTLYTPTAIIIEATRELLTASDVTDSVAASRILVAELVEGLGVTDATTYHRVVQPLLRVLLSVGDGVEVSATTIFVPTAFPAGPIELSLQDLSGGTRTPPRDDGPDITLGD